jgi:hypothetical protein
MGAPYPMHRASACGRRAGTKERHSDAFWGSGASSQRGAKARATLILGGLLGLLLLLHALSDTMLLGGTTAVHISSSSSSFPSPSSSTRGTSSDDNGDIPTRRRGNFVAIACTLSAYARKEDYDYLAPLTGANWFSFGFTPILLVVADNQKRIDEVRNVWEIVLPREAIVIPVIARNEASVTVAQISRLYIGSIVRELHPDAFLRVTDADVMIMGAESFRPVPGADIDIFNGNCCLQFTSVVGGRTCHQYPMHSVGMSVMQWRRLFPMAPTISKATDVTDFVLGLAKKHFAYQASAPSDIVLHGQNTFWSMDQTLLGCAVDEARERGYNVSLSPFPGQRLHVGAMHEIRNGYADVHLASFNLDMHRRWMDQLVNQTVVLTEYKDAYALYTEEWLKLKSEL